MSTPLSAAETARALLTRLGTGDPAYREDLREAAAGPDAERIMHELARYALFLTDAASEVLGVAPLRLHQRVMAGWAREGEP